MADNYSMEPDKKLKPLEILVGTWDVEINHPRINGTVGGSVTFEWFHGGKFLVEHSTLEDPVFPASIAMIGYNETSGDFTQHYFDSRGVIRNYDLSLKDNTLKIWRNDEDFAQRYTGEISQDGHTITGQWENAEDHVNYEHDFDITYKRVK